MVNRDRKRNTPGTGGIAIIAAILLFNALNIAAIETRTIGLVAMAIILLCLGFAVAFAMTKKKAGMKKEGSVYQKARAQEKAMQYFTREETAAEEKAVNCAHPIGKEKYIHQLDNFLANGIIDKNEYRVLKARYEKANIPENMH